MDKKKCVFAGTFDPPTLGHKSVVENCLAMFDEVVIALLVNPSKEPFFTAFEREEMWNLMLDEKQKERERSLFHERKSERVTRFPPRLRTEQGGNENEIKQRAGQ